MAYKLEILVVVVIFIESKHILPKNMTYTIKKYFFAHLLIVKEEKDIIEKIILSMFKDNI